MLDKEIKDYLKDCGRTNSININTIDGKPREIAQRCLLLDFIGETIACADNGWNIDEFTDSDWTEACNAYLDGLAEDYGCYYKYNPWKDNFELRKL